MPRYFLDTSALIKNYHAESGTSEVQRILAEPASDFFIARLAAVETLSGFASKLRTGVFSSTDYDKLRRRFFADVRKRVVTPLRVLNAHYQLAGELIGKHAMSRQLRTLDAVHLAVALYLHQVSPLQYFVCSNQKLCDVARLEGLDIIQP